MNMYRKLSALLLACAIAASTCLYSTAYAASDPPFDDISGSYARNQILDLYRNHIISGTTDRTFEPAKAITRSEFIAILDRTLNIQPVNSAIPSFIDVSPDSWYYGSVQAGAELGLIEGTSLNRFEPDKTITREEAASLLARALKQNVKDNKSIDLPFADSDQVSSWAIPYVDAVNRLELMEGYLGKFRPDEPITRQETSVVIDKLFTVPRWVGALNSSSSAAAIQLGWQYNETAAEYEKTIKQSTVNTLSPRWFFLGTDLEVTDNADASLISWAKMNNKKIWAMVGNRSDQASTHQLLSQSDKSAAVIKQLSAYAKKYKLDGLNIDFEHVAPGDKIPLSSFIANLAIELHSHNITLTVDVSPDTGTDWTDAFDYSALGKSADYLVLMAYDEHWSGDENAGSVSSLPWLTDAIGKLKSVVSANKIIAALPLYTRDWTIANGNTTSQELTIRQQNEIVDATELLPVWNSKLGQYTLSYTKDKQVHTVWLEDSRSLALKYQAAVSAGTAGTAYWYIGSESRDVWISLSNMRKYSTYSFSS